MSRNYNGWAVSTHDLLRHLEQQGVTPVHGRVIAEHVTQEYPATQAAPEVGKVSVIGHAHNDRVQAVVVSVEGTTTRPDGRIFHVTISLDDTKGARAVESNDLLAATEFTHLNAFALTATAF